MSNQTNAVKYYKVIKACAGLNVGDVVIKLEVKGKIKSAYHKLTDESDQKVVYCICKKSLRKLQIKQGTPDVGDKVLIVNPYMTSGEYALGDVIDVIKPSDSGVDIARSTGGTRFVARDEYVITMNWSDAQKKEMFGQFEQGTPVKVTHFGDVVTGTVESHHGFKVGDKVVYTSSSGDKVFGVVQGFSRMNSPFVQFTKETDYSHKGGNGNLKSNYTPLTTPTGYFVGQEKLQHFDAYEERCLFLASARDKANTEFTDILDKMDALVK